MGQNIVQFSSPFLFDESEALKNFIDECNRLSEKVDQPFIPGGKVFEKAIMFKLKS